MVQHWARSGVSGRAGSRTLNVTIKDLSPFLIPDTSMLSHQPSKPGGKTLCFVRVLEIPQTDSHLTNLRTTHSGQGLATLLGMVRAHAHTREGCRGHSTLKPRGPSVFSVYSVSSNRNCVWPTEAKWKFPASRKDGQGSEKAEKQT